MLSRTGELASLSFRLGLSEYVAAAWEAEAGRLGDLDIVALRPFGLFLDFFVGPFADIL
jgi:hypothetical protein